VSGSPIRPAPLGLLTYAWDVNLTLTKTGVRLKIRHYMFIKVDRSLMRSQDYDAALRKACDAMSSKGAKNFLHYTEPRVVELTETNEKLVVRADQAHGGIWLVRG
jgi:hypothetical protein